MLKIFTLSFLLTLASCGNDETTSKAPDLYQTDKVVIDYKVDLTPTPSGEEIKPLIFKVPAKIGEDEVVKISFVFNSLKNRFFKPVYFGNSCGKIAAIRFLNLENNTEIKKAKEVYPLESQTDYSLEVYIEKSSCPDPLIQISSWVGNSSNIFRIRNCIANLGTGQINFRHHLENPYPKISLGEFNTDFLGEGSFCGEKIKVKQRSCLNKIPNFSWECNLLGRDGKKYKFELNYHSGLNSGAYACKVNDVPIQLAQLTSCFDTILEK